MHDGTSRRHGPSYQPSWPSALGPPGNRTWAAVCSGSQPRWGLSMPCWWWWLTPLLTSASAGAACSGPLILLSCSSPDSHHFLRCLPAKAVWAEGTLGSAGLSKSQPFRSRFPGGSRTHSAWPAQFSQGQAVSWSWLWARPGGSGAGGRDHLRPVETACWQVEMGFSDSLRLWSPQLWRPKRKQASVEWHLQLKVKIITFFFAVFSWNGTLPSWWEAITVVLKVWGQHSVPVTLGFSTCLSSKSV